MCLAIPGRIVALHSARPVSLRPAGARNGASTSAGAEDADLWRMATVDFGGGRQQVSLACLPEARHGDRVLVRAGLAISLVEER